MKRDLLPILRVLALMMFSLWLSLVVGELFVRFFVGPPATMIFGGPQRDVQTDWDITYGVNENSRRMMCSSSEGKKRVAVLGDSFVFGQGVRDCADFSSLASAGSTQFHFENFGAIGIGMNEYSMIVRDLIGSDYDAVLLVFYGNDAYLLSDPRSLLGKLADRSSMFALIRKAERAMTVNLALESLEQGHVFNNVVAMSERYPNYFSGIANPNQEDLTVFGKAFDALVEDLRRKDIEQIYVTVAPIGNTVSRQLRDFITGNGGSVATFREPGAFYELVKVLSEKQGLSFIDTYPVFMNAGERAYFRHDMHWSEYGHAEMANLLLNRIN